MTAAAWSIIPAAAPEVTRPASAPVYLAIISPARWLSSPSLTMTLPASAMAWSTSGSMIEPPKVAGASHGRILYRHILPQVAHVLIVITTLRTGGLIIAEAGLSFLGVGVPASTPTWGIMISEGQKYLLNAWWLSIFPGLAIFLTVMAFNFLGYWMRDRFDPTLRQLRR